MKTPLPVLTILALALALAACDRPAQERAGSGGSMPGSAASVQGTQPSSATDGRTAVSSPQSGESGSVIGGSAGGNTTSPPPAATTGGGAPTTPQTTAGDGSANDKSKKP